GGPGLVLRLDVDGVERAHEGRERLEGGAHHHRLPARHAALGAARVVGAALEAARALVEVDLAVHLRAGTARGLDPGADPAPLVRPHAPGRPRQAPVELAIPLRVAAEAGREADRDRLHHAPQRVARRLALVDARQHPPRGLRVGHAHGRLLAAREDLLGRERTVLGRDAADLRHPPEDPDAEGGEQALRDPAHRDSRRGLARARALEHVAHVAVVVLERAGQVRMAGPRPRDREIRIPVLGPGRHLLLPVAPVPVLDPECDGRPERLAPAYAGADLDLVLLDLHAAAA